MTVFPPELLVVIGINNCARIRRVGKISREKKVNIHLSCSLVDLTQFKDVLRTMFNRFLKEVLEQEI